MKKLVLMLAIPILLAAAPTQSTKSQQGATRSGTPPTQSNASQNAISAGQIMRQNGGSLLKATLASQADPSQAEINAVSFFAVPAPEPKVLKKHDLVTIIVREQTDFSAEGTTDLKKDYDLEFAIEEFLNANINSISFEPNAGTASEIALGGNNRFKGEATVDRVDALITRITAEVVDVKPNGTLVLQASAFTKFDEEETTTILSGTCRAEDVTPDNTILSTQLHDKNLSKIHKGAVRDTTRRGWIPRIFDWLRLF